MKAGQVVSYRSLQSEGSLPVTPFVALIVCELLVAGALLALVMVHA